MRKQKNLIGYVTRAKLQNKVFSSIDDLKVVPDEKIRKMLITKRVSSDEGFAYICYECSDLQTIENMTQLPIEGLKSGQCLHSNLSEIVFENTKEWKTKKQNENVNLVHIVKESNNETIVVVKPSEKHKKTPGILQKSERMKQIKCYSCKGTKYIHLNVFKSHQESKKEMNVNLTGEKKMNYMIFKQ
jgi:hypothetical protein